MKNEHCKPLLQALATVTGDTIALVEDLTLLKGMVSCSRILSKYAWLLQIAEELCSINIVEP